MTNDICLISLDRENHTEDYACLDRRMQGYQAQISNIPAINTVDAVSKAISFAGDGFITLLCVPCDKFLEAKYNLIKSAGKMVKSSKIVTRAASFGIDTSLNQYNLITAIPEMSKIFIPHDPTYTAFAFKHEAGLLALLPVDLKEQSEVFSVGFDTLLASLAKKVYSPADIRTVIKNIVSSGKSVAVSSIGLSESVLKLVNSVESGGSFEKDESEITFLSDEENYIALCAKQAKEKCRCDYGVAVSQINSDGDDRFVTVCVSTSKNAWLADVYAFEEEEPKQLLMAAVIKLCSMLEDASKTDPLLFGEEKEEKKINVKPLIIVLAVVAVTLIVCAVLTAAAYFKTLSSDTPEEAEEITTVSEPMTDDPEMYYIPEDEVIFEDFIPEEYLLEDMTEENTELSAEEATSEQLEVETTAKATTDTTTKATTIESTSQTVAQTAKETTAAESTTPAVTATESASSTVSAQAEAASKLRHALSELNNSLITTTLFTTATGVRAKDTTTQQAETTGERNEETYDNSSVAKGTFVFTTYGYGHGVGLSQNGAIAMAKSGSDYKAILTHYFPGTTIKTDSSTPSNISYGGNSYETIEYLCRTVSREIGSSAPLEALKAQASAAYSYAKANKFSLKSSSHAFQNLGGKSFESYYGSGNVMKACLAVLDMSSLTDSPKANYIDYAGSAVSAYYFASAAGKTTSSSSVWGGTAPAYLAGGVSSPETVAVKRVEVSSEKVKKYIEKYASANGKSVKLSSDPSQWIKILSHDGAYNSKIGYAATVSIGGCEIRGYQFRSKVMVDESGDMLLRSHCFTVEYVG